MISLVLATWLTAQTWAWSKVPDTDVVAYRIYWSALTTVWCPTQRSEVPLDCWDAGPPDGWLCQGDVVEPPFSPAYFIVTAVDAAGNESLGEHGPLNGVCP